MISEKILRSFENSKILVTGGTGLIGRQAVKILCDASAKVTIVSLDNVNVDNRAEHILGDLCDFKFCKDICKDQDYVLHLAGIKGSIEVSKTMTASHFVPTLMMNTNMLEAIRLCKVKKAVYTSSIGAYPNAEIFEESEKYNNPPMDFAGWAKRMGELQVKAYLEQYGQNNIAIVRPSNVYGPGDNFNPNNAMVIASLLGRIARGEAPLKVWGDGKAKRDFLFSRDAAKGVILALYHGTGGDFINLGSGKGTSIADLVKAMQQFIDFEYIFDTSKPSGAPLKIMNITRAETQLGFKVETDLVDGLKETWNWFIENTDEHLKKKNYFL